MAIEFDETNELARQGALERVWYAEQTLDMVRRNRKYNPCFRRVIDSSVRELQTRIAKEREFIRELETRKTEKCAKCKCDVQFWEGVRMNDGSTQCDSCYESHIPHLRDDNDSDEIID